MGRHLTPLLARLAVGCALFFALAGPASAAPCWKSVVLDWSADGTVDKTYPIACYHQAIAHLQPDLKLYSSASDDIRRALQQVVTTTSEPPTTTQTTPDPAPATTAQTTTEQTTTDEAPAAPPPTTTVDEAPPPPPPLAVGDTGEGDSVPLPLIVLGGLAILLVALGLAGMIWRRSQGNPPGTP